jgi:hypothetical protein
MYVISRQVDHFDLTYLDGYRSQIDVDSESKSGQRKDEDRGLLRCGNISMPELFDAAECLSMGMPISNRNSAAAGGSSSLRLVFNLECFFTSSGVNSRGVSEPVCR